jgi:hypothetical protein
VLARDRFVVDVLILLAGGSLTGCTTEKVDGSRAQPDAFTSEEVAFAAEEPHVDVLDGA